MGLGANLSMNSRFRVATENSVIFPQLFGYANLRPSRHDHGLLQITTGFPHYFLFQSFAMPETELGLFPDGGSSFFLSRLPGFLGKDVYIGHRLAD